MELEEDLSGAGMDQALEAHFCSTEMLDAYGGDCCLQLVKFVPVPVQKVL